MIREAFGTAKTVDEAIQAGCLLLGVDRDKAEFEIIDLPKRGLFRRKDAKVRVFVEVAEERPKPAPREAQPRAPKERPEPKQRPHIKDEAKPEPRPEHKADRKPEVKQEKTKKIEHKAPAKKEHNHNTEVINPAPETVAKAQLAVDYVKGILEAMGLSGVTINPVFTSSGVSLALTGEGLGVIIGRRGETLDSLQYLAGLVANRPGGEYLRVTIDSGNYRQKRESTLEGLARKLANQVVRTGKNCTLEPMNPYERRIIHAAVSSVKGASSSSVGEEPNRRVVISPTGERSATAGERKPRPPRRGGRSRGPKRDERDDRDERPSRGGYRDYRDDLVAEEQRRVPEHKADEARPVHTNTDAKPVKTEAKQPKDKTLYEAELGGKLYGKIEI